MAKEWILNIATNRWGLNKKDIVGPVSLWIRECNPKTKQEWESFYFKRLDQMLKTKGISIPSRDYICSLGQKLYVKITEVIRAEIEDVSEEDCIAYIHNLVIDRTFEGYQTEIKTIYGKLQKELGINIHPAPDDWDRLYNVDFYIQIENKYIRLQIKPISYEQTPEIHKWKKFLSETHDKFRREQGGNVFIIFSIKKDGEKVIFNEEVIDEIRKEIERLKNEVNPYP